MLYRHGAEKKIHCRGKTHFKRNGLHRCIVHITIIFSRYSFHSRIDKRLLRWPYSVGMLVGFTSSVRLCFCKLWLKHEAFFACGFFFASRSSLWIALIQVNILFICFQLKISFNQCFVRVQSEIFLNGCGVFFSYPSSFSPLSLIKKNWIYSIGYFLIFIRYPFIAEKIEINFHIRFSLIDW